MTTAAWALVLAFVLFFALMIPVWPYSIVWGYYPSGAILILLLLFVTLLLLGALGEVNEPPTVRRAEEDRLRDEPSTRHPVR